MGDLMNGIASGMAGFVFAWLVPAAVAVALAALVLGDELATMGTFHTIFDFASAGELAATAAFIGVTFTLAVLLAYSALPIYRLLEGYHLPRSISTRMRNRHIRKWRRLNALQDLSDETGISVPGLNAEILLSYPDEEQFIMPTRLGNSLKALERFGSSRYGCDSQMLWYELQAVAPEALREDTSQGRAPVDFFVGSVTCFSALVCVSLVVGILRQDLGAGALALIAALVVVASYQGAVRNMKDWANSVKALVNLCRLDVAARLGLVPPWDREGERHMWEQYIGAIEYNDPRFAHEYDEYRRPRVSSSDDSSDDRTQP